MWNTFWDGCGVPWEFDPGPPASSDYAELFAQTPNYLGIGHAVLGSEGFRWRHGPVFYRGPLGQNKVRVLVIERQGRQDEALAPRAFVGDSGARMQHLLKFLISSSIRSLASTAQSCATLTRLVGATGSVRRQHNVGISAL